MEVVIECARVFGNFSQEPEIRDLLRLRRADELLVVLLNHETREVVFTVCGVLMNLMGDDEGRAVLRQTDGIASLVEVRVSDAPHLLPTMLFAALFVYFLLLFFCFACRACIRLFKMPGRKVEPSVMFGIPCAYFLLSFLPLCVCVY